MSLILDRLVSRTRLSWSKFTVVVGFVFILLAVGIAYLDGVLGGFFSADHWRMLLAYPVTVLYILAIFPPLRRASDNAIKAFRPLVSLDDEGFNRLVSEASTVNPKGEWAAFGIGAAIGFLGTFWELGKGFSWLGLYLCFASSLTLGLLVWTVYVSLAGAKQMAALHHHLLTVDILDLKAFEPIGHQSLMIALTFVGGGVMGMLFTFGGKNTFAVEALVPYGVLVLVATLIFFLPMRQTHRVLAAAKERELEAVQCNIVTTYRSLEGLSAESKDISTLSTKLNLWVAYERRLKATRTWPYNLSMLRTLFVSVLIPVALSLVQKLIGQLFNL